MLNLVSTRIIPGTPTVIRTGRPASYINFIAQRQYTRRGSAITDRAPSRRRLAALAMESFFGINLGFQK